MNLHRNKKHWLFTKLSMFHDRKAIIYKDKNIGYSELLESCNQWIDTFSKHSIKSGEAIGVCGDFNPNMSTLFLALILNKNIIVPVTSFTPLTQNKFYDLAQINHVIEIKSDGQNITTLKRKAIPAQYETLKAKNQSGLVLFSSGTTGENKAVVLNIEALISKFRYQTNKRTRLAFLSIDHLGGFDTMLGALATGEILIIPENRTPKTICQLIQRHKVELLPTTPTFLNLLLTSNCYQQYNLDCLQCITYSSEPMGEITLNKLKRCFPHAIFKQAYGLSELGVIPTKSLQENSLWFKIRNDIPYKIIENTLYLKAKSCMLGYLNATNNIDKEGWFNTGDKVKSKVVDDEIYIRILGRQSEIINVGGEKVYPAEVEDIVQQLPFILDAYVYGKKNPVTGEIVAIKINVLPSYLHDKSLEMKIRKFCKDKLEPYKIPQFIEIEEEPLYSKRFKKKRRACQIKKSQL